MSKIVDRIFNTVLTADDSTAQEELGAFRFEDGKIYRYVQFQDAVTAAAGGPVVLEGTYNYKVTVDLSLGFTDCPAGVALTTNTPEYYGWIQIYGVGTVATANLATAGDYMIVSTDNVWAVGATDFASDVAVAVTAHKIGAIALSNSGTTAGTTITAFVRCM